MRRFEEIKVNIKEECKKNGRERRRKKEGRGGEGGDEIRKVQGWEDLKDKSKHKRSD